MHPWLRHGKFRDLRFMLLVMANLGCIGGFLLAQVPAPQQDIGGWRRIDLEALVNRIETGDLLKHEASWYEAAPKRESTKGR
jgi:hypothetical protein